MDITHKSRNNFCFHFLIYGKKIHQKVHRAEKILAIQIFIVNFFFLFCGIQYGNKLLPECGKIICYFHTIFFCIWVCLISFFLSTPAIWPCADLYTFRFFVHLFVCLVTVVWRFFQCSEVSLIIIKKLADSNFTKMIRALW